MGYFRSEDMSLFEISIPKDSAWEIMNELGDLGCLHILDLNKNEQVFNLRFASLIKRCEETEKRVNFLISECTKHQIELNNP